MIRIAVSGACGKMGSRIINLALNSKELEVTVALERRGHSQVGKLLKGIRISDDSEEIKNADVLIEFTTPEATMEHLSFALRYRRALVVGTTGLNEDQKDRIKEASKRIPVVFSPNMSIGANLLFRLAREAGGILSKDYNVNIVEAHHIHKKDAPSGTAKRLAKIIKESTGLEVQDIKSIREGEIVGDHKVTFDGPYEVIVLTHSAKSRDIFAQGALTAAKWLVGKKARLYDMQDVLG